MVFCGVKGYYVYVGEKKYVNEVLNNFFKCFLINLFFRIC